MQVRGVCHKVTIFFIILEYIQMTTELKNDIVQYCKQINEKCEIEFQNFNFDSLKNRKWYLNILQILFPHLEQKINQIKQVKGQARAINRIIQEINELDQFENLQIDGNKIAFGDPNQISNLVQVILALLQIVTEEYEQGQVDNQQDAHKFQNNLKKNMQDEHQKQKKSLSDYDKPKSVQAIVNQFEKSEDEDQSVAFGDALPQKQTQPRKPHTIESNQKKSNFEEPYKKFPNFQDKSEDSSQRKYLKHKIEQKKNHGHNLKVFDPEKQKQKLLIGVHSKKKLVTHPKSPQTLKKARSSNAIALTKKVQEDIKKTKKKPKNSKPVMRPMSPMQQEMKRKNKEYDYVSNQYHKQKSQKVALKKMKKDVSQKNDKNLEKILNFREEQIKRQKKEYEQSIKMKLMSQKELYIKKINKLIIELEKQKERQQKKDFKEALIKDNEQAVKKLTTLQEWYKNKLSMLKQNRKQKNKERVMLKTGHKEIIGQIERELKRQNEQKLLQLTNQYRSEQNNIETDFEELKSKIIKVYQRN